MLTGLQPREIVFLQRQLVDHDVKLDSWKVSQRRFNP